LRHLSGLDYCLL